MKWVHADLLYLMWLVLVLLGLLEWHAWRTRQSALARFGQLSLVEQLIASRDLRRRRWKVCASIVAAGLLVMALARPQLGGQLEMTRRRGVDVIVALDVSRSMLVEDMKPTRLAAAKREIASFFEKLQGDRVGLVIFAGEAFVQCPWTLDYQAARLFLDSVDIDAVPVPGTAISKAIQRATAAFVKQERKHKVLVLVTDGESHVDNPIEAAEEARRAGVKIHAIGLGSPEGEPIPVRDAQGQVSGHMKTASGEIVLSRLDEATLQKIALTTGGTYFRATAGQLELDSLYELIAGMEEKALADRLYMHYQERHQYVVALVIVLLVVGWWLPERRKVAA